MFKFLMLFHKHSEVVTSRQHITNRVEVVKGKIVLFKVEFVQGYCSKCNRSLYWVEKIEIEENK